MRILHVIAQLPARTGSGVYFGNLIEELKKYGHEQAALYAVQDDHSFDILASGSRYPVCFKTGRLSFPIPGMSDVMPYESTMYGKMSEDMLEEWHGAFEAELLRAKREFQPDILISHHLWMLTSIAAGIFESQIKIGVCHNTDIRQGEQNPEMKSKYAANLNRLDLVFSLSDSQKQVISDTFGIDNHKITTIGGGFNQNLFYPPIEKKKNDKVEILFSGKIEKSKGVYELVSAFKGISETNKNLHLDIVGKPNAENAPIIHSYIEGADNITLTPTRSQKEIADYIREKDIYVMPSYFEGVALMAIECLASGLRVVASEIEALMELLGDKVNNSGAIEYVKLPRIYDTDKPYEEDLDQFIEEFSSKLRLQIKRVERGEPFPEDVISEINKYSWTKIAEKINAAIAKYYRS